MTLSCVRCVARDTLQGGQCGRPCRDGLTNLCATHTIARAKLVRSYKAPQLALEKILEVKPVDIEKTLKEDYTTLKSTYDALLRQWRLISRCIYGRAVVKERFFSFPAEEDDAGHRTFLKHLEDRRVKIERQLALIQQRAYELLVKERKAVWLLRDQKTCRRNDACTDTISRKDGPPPPNGPASVANECREKKDPIDEALAQKRDIYIRSIRRRISDQLPPKRSKFYGERLQVIYAVIRRIVAYHPRLMLLSQPFKTVEEFLEDEVVGVPELEILLNGLWGPDACVYRGAMYDVFIGSENEENIFILGERVYKEDPDKGRLPPRVFAHMAAMRDCHGCASKVCRTVDEHIDLMKVWVSLRQEHLFCRMGNELLVQTLAAFGIVVTNTESNRRGMGFAIEAAFRPSDSSSRACIEWLLREAEIQVKPTIQSNYPSGLASKASEGHDWLQQGPRIIPEEHNYKNSQRLILIDKRSRSWKEFTNNIGWHCLEALKTSEKEFLKKLKDELVASGELEVDKGGDLIPNLAIDEEFAAYAGKAHQGKEVPMGLLGTGNCLWGDSDAKQKKNRG